MVQKYVSGVEDNVVRYRDVSRIARAENAGADSKQAADVIVRLIRQPRLSISDAFEESVHHAYEQRDLLTRANLLLERIAGIKSKSHISAELRATLNRLRSEITRLLGE